MPIQLIDTVEETDRFGTTHPVNSQILSKNDLQNDNLYVRSNIKSEEQKISEQKVEDFLESNNIKQNGELSLLEIKTQSKSILDIKPKHDIKSTGLQCLFNRIKKIELTKHEILIIILNIFMFIICILIFYFLKPLPRKISVNIEEILLVRKGENYGGGGGDFMHEDDKIAELDFNDTITSIAVWESTDLRGIKTLLSLQFSYSKGKKGYKFGGAGSHPIETEADPLVLAPNERIIQIKTYIDGREIDNQFIKGLTQLVVGISFKTNYNNEITYGLASGTENTESFKDYFLAFPRGKAVGYIDLLSFTWYKLTLKNSTIDENFR